MGNIALITGTSSGLGLAVAEYLLSKSWRVIGLARSESKIDNRNYIHKQVDISNFANLVTTFADLKNEDINLLINNAASFSMGQFIDTDIATINTIIDTNIKGTMYVTQLALNLMHEDSRIVFINSVAGLEELKYQSIYCASKYALTAFAGVLGEELRTRKIRVTTIHPGGINTPLWERNVYPGDDVGKTLDPVKLAELVDYVYNLGDTEFKTVKIFPTNEWHK